MGSKSIYSVATVRTSLTSILKPYTPIGCEKASGSAVSKVRFEISKEAALSNVINAIDDGDNDVVREFCEYIRGNRLQDADLLLIINDARKQVNKLGMKYAGLVEALLSIPWLHRSSECQQQLCELYVDILVAQNKYLNVAVNNLIKCMIPTENESSSWPMGFPTADVVTKLNKVHQLLERILKVIPFSADAILKSISNFFPYYKRSSLIIAGYIYNLLRILDYKPMFTEYILQLIFENMIIMDVNIPRSEIETPENDDEDCVDDEGDDELENNGNHVNLEIKNEENENENDDQPMDHPLAHTLDLCMLKMFNFLRTQYTKLSGTETTSPPSNSTEKCKNEVCDESAAKHTRLTSGRNWNLSKFFNILITVFDNAILATHNSHYVQFVIFYFCSFKSELADRFLISLWEKVQNPNCPPIVRQATIGYLASFLARAKYVNINVLQAYLRELCNWAHQYIKNSRRNGKNCSLKAHLVFFSVCQAIFYIIAFRSRDLTEDSKRILFLQSLQLSGLVTSYLNPLRVCLPVVATIFAGVTRAYQLAYCHAILERNARRKLAMVYVNETASPEETLDTIFPFDPYLLKLSGKYIPDIYLQYQPSQAEIDCKNSPNPVLENNSIQQKRSNSVLSDEINDAWIEEKRPKANV